MTKYIDIVLTKDGYFCVAPPWTIEAGDYISLPDFAVGGDKLREVISVATDEEGGAYITMIEKYLNYPIPRVTQKFVKREVEWDVPVFQE